MTLQCRLIYKLFLILFTSIGLASLGWAEEVDDYFDPTHKPEDAEAVIDVATNALLNELVQILNASQLKQCSDPARYTLAIKKLDQNFTAIGNGLRAGPELKKLFLYQESEKRPVFQKLLDQRRKELEQVWLAEFPINQQNSFAHLFSSIDYFGNTKTDQSIYTNMDFPTCCVSRINVGGTYVGVDKIDHFFGNGGLLFEQFQFQESPSLSLESRLQSVMVTNIRQEHSLWGLKGLSPKSYGDIAANWQGFQFYRNLFDEEQHYIDCRDGHFEINKTHPFRIHDYLDEAWNESYNCSSFESQEDLDLFRSNLKKAGFQCPRSQSVCEHLKEKHQSDALFVSQALSPLCSGSDPQFVPIEEPYPIPWSEVELALRGFTWPIIKDIITTKAATLITHVLPDFMRGPSILAAQSVLVALQKCRNENEDERLNCVRHFTSPSMTKDQFIKFSFVPYREFSDLFPCPEDSNTVEKLLHPKGLGDLSLCFTNKAKNPASLGRIYFQKHPEGLKVLLMRF